MPSPPTEQDIENARRRQEIEGRFQREYDEALALAEAAFGPGWEPCGRNFLVDKDEEERARKGGVRMLPAATVYSARKDGVTRQFTEVDGVPKECASVEEGFGAMYHERHPNRGFEHRGRWIPCQRYSLYWAGYELYEPKTPEQLALARQKREARAVAREAEASPLFADPIRAEGYMPKRKGKPR